MSGRLSQKTALITGAAQGMGYEIAKAFAAEGARVIATDINVKNITAVGAELACEAMRLDVGDGDAIAACAKRFPEVNVLVNCAGIVRNGTILDCSEEDWALSLQLNVTSMYRTIRAFLPSMLASQNGSIINIASVVSSVKGAANRCAYSSSKAAIIGLTKSVALDFIAQGVRCNSISPGTVESPSLQERMAASGDFETARQAFIDRQPMGRLGKPEEIAAVAVMLAADEAGFMTGTNVVIDGGWSI